MFDEKLREEVVKILGLGDASEADQDEALVHIESIANKRFARAVPEMLDDNQLNHVESMQATGDDYDKIAAWIETQIPEHEELLEAVIKDVAEEIANS